MAQKQIPLVCSNGATAPSRKRLLLPLFAIAAIQPEYSFLIDRLHEVSKKDLEGLKADQGLVQVKTICPPC